MPDSRFVLRSHVLLEAERNSEEAILIDGHTGTMCSCNATAGALLSRLEDGASTEELAEALLARFEVSPAVASRDVMKFLDTLSAMGVLAVAETGSAAPAAA